MYCSNCSKDIGNSLGLCPECQSKNLARQSRGLEAHASQRKPSARKVLSAARGGANLGFIGALMGNDEVQKDLGKSVFLWVVGFVALTAVFAAIFHSTFEDHELVHSLVLGMTAAALFGAVLGWTLMWMELLIDNALMCIVSIFLPISVYWVLITHPERAMRPFVIHLIASALFIYGHFTYSGPRGETSLEMIYFFFEGRPEVATVEPVRLR
jgi:hypothetical protein